MTETETDKGQKQDWKLKAAGWAESDLHVLPYESEPGNKTAALIARWPSANPTAKPILILAHMDVVEALRSDWTTDPFQLVEKDGYFYGRGSGDDKGGLVPSMVALMKLRAEGFKPNRDIVLLFTGDEETQGKGAELGATEWRKWTDAEFALNADGGGGGSDGQVGVTHADHIEQQRCRQHRAAAAEHRQQQPDQRAARQGGRHGDRAQGHRVRLPGDSRAPKPAGWPCRRSRSRRP